MPPAQLGHTNAHYSKVQEWRATILEHPVFNNITQEMPRSVRGAGGMLEPFNDAHFTAFVNRGTTNEDDPYEASINFFWCDPVYSPMLEMPLNTDFIKNMADDYFKFPASGPRATHRHLSG